MACLARMRDDMLCYITGTTVIYSVHEHDFKSPWLWDVNCGNGSISLTIF